jgi:predicted peptidase
MRSNPFWLAGPVLLLGLAGITRGEDMAQLLEKRMYKDADGKALRYRLLKPDRYDAHQKYPLVLFLHGAGERGDDNIAQLIHGVPEFAKDENRKKYPCFLAAPQCPANEKWADVDWSAAQHRLTDRPAESLRLALEMVESLQKEFAIDSHRLYITGLSMGGFGTWDAITRHPDRFAAAVPVCGGGDETKAERIARLPIWVFHGAKDDAVKPSRSLHMLAALMEAGGMPGYSQYPNVGHDSWVPAYRDGRMLEWLFGQKRK